MSRKNMHRFLNYIIAAIWIANGLFCKLLNVVPRHELIVARILGDAHSRIFTIIIGGSEVFMALWILSGIKSRLNAWVQIIVIAVMNTLEFILVPDLLLWGKYNAVFAFLLIVLVYVNEFYLNKNTAQKNYHASLT